MNGLRGARFSEHRSSSSGLFCAAHLVFDALVDDLDALSER